MRCEIDIIEESLIHFINTPKNKKQVVEILVEQLFLNGRVINPVNLVSEVIDREKDGLTGLIRGVAIPHAKSNYVLLPSIAIARLSMPLEWKTLDNSKVHTIFLLAGNDCNTQKEQNERIIKLAGAFSEDEFFDSIEKCSSEKEFLVLVNEALQKKEEDKNDK